MILVDANLLIYARSNSFPQHEAARSWLDQELNRGRRVALPWESLLASIRILSNPRIVERPESMDSLWEQIEAWRGVEAVWIPVITDRHALLLKNLRPHVSRSDLVSDAHLAALAISHGLTLMSTEMSTDGDFARFPELR